MTATLEVVASGDPVNHVSRRGRQSVWPPSLASFSVTSETSPFAFKVLQGPLFRAAQAGLLHSPGQEFNVRSWKGSPILG